MSFPAYAEYRDSNVGWLGGLPAHWQTMRFSRVVSIAEGQVDPRVEPYASMVLIAPNHIEGGTGRLVALETAADQGADSGKYQFATGEVIYSKIRPALAKVVLAPCDGLCSADMYPLRGVEGLTSPYLKWVLLCPEFTAWAVLESDRVAMPKINREKLNEFRLPIPSVEEQRTIAAFLDRETDKIDALVEAQERLITLLKEKRQAVISHAVTKGLDPSAPMKDSGVEWLGQVPAYWEVTALKRLCTLITDGAHISPETENGVYCFVSTRDVSQAGIDFDGCLRTSEASYEYLYRTGCQPKVGDVLFSKDGTIGRTVVVREQRDFVVASSLIIIRPDREILDAEFLDFLCQSDAIQDQVESFVKGAGLPRLSIANLMRVIGIFPPIHEQRLIATTLAEASVRFTALVAEAEAAITLLQERRAALISAAVTGKIDVRGLVQTAEAA